MKTGIVVNRMETEEPSSTTTHWALELMRRGHDVSYIEVGGFTYRIDEMVHARSYQPSIGSTPNPETLVNAFRGGSIPADEIAVDELDVLLLRSDPAQEIFSRPWARLAGVNFGRLAVRHGVLVLNDPDGLDRAVNKMYLQHFPREIRPEAIITRDPRILAEFCMREGPVVIKPLTGSGGRNVFLIEKPGDVNFQQMVAAVLRDGYVLAQEYLPEAQEGDTRVFLMNGEILRHKGEAAVLRRTRPAGDMRSNLTVGGRAVSTELTPAIEYVAKQLAPRLLADGMFLVGADVVRDKVLEINVFSPGALVAASQVAGVEFIEAVVDSLEDKVERFKRNTDRPANAMIATA